MLVLSFPPLLLCLSLLHYSTSSPTNNEGANNNEVTPDSNAAAAPTFGGTLDEKAAIEFITRIDEESDRQHHQLLTALWNFNVKKDNDTKSKLAEAQKSQQEFSRLRWQLVGAHRNLRQTLKDQSLVRQLKQFSVLGTSVLPKAQFDMLNGISNRMQEIYGFGKICDYHKKSKCDLPLQPDVENILSSSRDYDELTHIWKAWRDAVGKPNRMFFEMHNQLGNLAANMNGFPTTTEMLLDVYESETLEADLGSLLEQLSPLYKQLHAYTRRNLRQIYGEEKVTKRGPIPANILGDMWAESWARIYDVLAPYPDKPFFDVTQNLVNESYTPKKMLELADEFFASMNLERVPESFWRNSIIEEPKDDESFSCQSSVWDFKDGKDFRMQHCTVVNMENLYTIHQKMGQIQYFMQYKDQPHPFKKGANEGFTEAIGDVIGLSISFPKHFQRIGLLKSYERDEESELNFLMKSALQKVAFIPYGYLTDMWRWDAYRSRSTPNNYTCTWWNYRYHLQGITPPVTRTEEDFDPAAKFHVAAQFHYLPYLVSFVTQFQIFKAACIKAGDYDPNDPQKPLHLCDIYGSVEAGNALRDLMKAGASEPWQVTLKQLTGSDKMDVSALREYFLPLEKWLIDDNKKHDEFVGWEGEDDFCAKLTNAPIEENIEEYPVEPFIEFPEVEARRLHRIILS